MEIPAHIIKTAKIRFSHGSLILSSSQAPSREPAAPHNSIGRNAGRSMLWFGAYITSEIKEIGMIQSMAAAKKSFG